ncbi:hypothetical protein ELG63_36420 [Rhizobium leguminosarum]|uniref:hypothetical protein n=1 Tax=Rhizobium leguminosarum TaxID=384 RepID=UPI00102F4A9E|nr:hypothetical protein [Rhizobium leguminosarum]TBH28175.1 hypothetical protein ELG63_36420 [Rhizobium leguminosarum]
MTDVLPTSTEVRPSLLSKMRLPKIKRPTFRLGFASDGVPDDYRATWPNMEVAKIASRGRVLGARVSFLAQSKVMRSALIGVGLFAGYHLAINVASAWMPEVQELPHVNLAMQIDHRPPDFIMNMGQQSAATYFDLGGGLQGDGRLAWMAGYRPRPDGLTVGNLNDLVVAMRKDLPRFGKAAKPWDNVLALPFGPKVSGAEQAISKFSDRLQTGILIVLRDSDVVPFVAHAEGQWSVLLFKDKACRAFVGPVPSGCEDRTKSGSVPNDVRPVLSMIAPRG